MLEVNMDFNIVKPKIMTDEVFHYCPGCGHGIIHRLIGEVIDSLEGDIVCVFGIGCCNYVDKYFHFDSFAALHGRAPAVATGIKRSLPDTLVFTYQGDGDLSAIGLNEFLHTANRGENLTSILVTNGVFGMTGGQMAPTTLIGQKTTTTPCGRLAEKDGHPLLVSKLIEGFEGVKFNKCIPLTTPKQIRKAKDALYEAFSLQRQKKGFGLLEFLSPCPTNLRLRPVDAFEWVEEKMNISYSIAKGSA
jgi:2-oxoglutarate/2-oxoacid ferredoxin oxidoreductase subunit beta